MENAALVNGSVEGAKNWLWQALSQEFKSMSCNAFNHPPGCNCGWGGVYYEPSLQTSSNYWGRTESYTIPNARCPRCAARVFFYRSPEGGSVYFDDLGPPWPKHPCMDTGKRTEPAKGRLLGSSVPQWKRDGWHPLPVEDIRVSDSNPLIVVLSLGGDLTEKRLYANTRIENVRINCPSLWRRASDARGHYEISTLDLTDTGFKEIRFEAFDVLDELEKQVRAEALEVDIKSFDDQMKTLKIELLKDYRDSDLEAKLDALIANYQEHLRAQGNLLEICNKARESLLHCVQHWLDVQEKLDHTITIHAELKAEEVKILEEYAASGCVLHPVLRDARKKAISKELPLEASKALMWKAAQTEVNARLKALERKRLAIIEAQEQQRINHEINSYITEFSSQNTQIGSKGKQQLKQKLIQALSDRPQDVEVIKEILQRNAAEFLANKTEAIALNAERLRARRERDAIKKLIVDATIRHPNLNKTEFKSAIARMTNEDSTKDEVQAAIDLVLKKLLANRSMQAKKSKQRTKNSNNNKNDHSRRPFNSAMSDQLKLAIERNKVNSKDAAV